jgi:hypothetical protein
MPGMKELTRDFTKQAVKSPSVAVFFSCCHYCARYENPGLLSEPGFCFYSAAVFGLYFFPFPYKKLFINLRHHSASGCGIFEFSGQPPAS